MSRVDHPPSPHEDPDVGDAVCAITTVGPKNHITRLRLCSRKVPAHGRVVLSLSSAGDRFALCFAHGVLGESLERRMSV